MPVAGKVVRAAFIPAANRECDLSCRTLIFLHHDMADARQFFPALSGPIRDLPIREALFKVPGGEAFVAAKNPRKPFVAGVERTLPSLEQNARREPGLMPGWIEVFALRHGGG